MKKEDFPDITFSGVIHVGACRAEELKDHVEFGAKKIIWIEANPDVYGEMQINLIGSDVENYSFCVACTDSDDKEIQFNLIYGPDANFMVGNKGCSSALEPVGRFESWFKEKIIVFYFHSLYQYLLEVLMGAKEVLKNIKYIYSEVTFFDPDYKDSPLFDDINNFLENNGFEHLKTIMQAPNWGDALFVRKGLV